ncbi:extracellular solute-binding protein [Vibrio sp. SCSIO 43140]|uniref:ABC transporter substrate-binding protein n=1 Tax=Vibrio sp. SCSIO 43140 TaxID=2819100 RepID=UPI0020758683|nr:extracellular solute-binding protein [Vibrio sp. SCSIO 43140]USD62137.1 extracellular solute-binding protein [Vibrio sp. SCSIO 43140]
MTTGANKGSWKKHLLHLSIVLAGAANAADYEISVVAGGAGPNDHYRTDAIEMAASILMQEADAAGEELNIKVNKRSYADWDSFKQAVTLAAESGSAPDIVVTGHVDIAPWAQSGLIAPVEDYVDMDAWPLNNLYPNLVEISSFNGMIYGIPQDSEARPFFAWKQYLAQIGYDQQAIDTLPDRIESGEYTLYDMLEDAKKAQDEGLVAKGYGFYPRVTNGPDFWQFYTSFGGELQDPETGRLIFDKAAMEKTFQFFADAVEMGVTRRNHLGTPWDQWYAEVASGKAAFWHGGTWHYSRYTEAEGLDDFFGNVQFGLIPTGDKEASSHANTLTHPVVYLITQQDNEDKMEVAAKLIKIASEPRINTLHAIKSSHLGISPEQMNIGLYNNDRWAMEATERLLPHANSMPNNADFGAFWNIYWKGLEAAWTGQKTPKQAVADAETELRGTLGNGVIIQ